MQIEIEHKAYRSASDQFDFNVSEALASAVVFF